MVRLQRIRRVRVNLLTFLVACGLIGASVGLLVRAVFHAREMEALTDDIHDAGGHVQTSGVSVPFVWPRSIYWVSFPRSQYAIGNDLLSRLSRLKTLTSLYLEDHQLSAADFTTIGEMKKLEHLSLCGSHVTDVEFPKLLGLQKLRFLNVSSNPLHEESLTKIEQLVQLEELCVADTWIPLARLQRLSLPKLQTLDASECHGKTLDLTPSGFGSIPSLKRLSLRGCRVTEVLLDKNAPLTGLNSLDIRCTWISIAGFADSLPNVVDLAIDPRGMHKETLIELTRYKSLRRLVVSEGATFAYFGDPESDSGYVECKFMNVDHMSITAPCNLAAEVKKFLPEIYANNPRLRISHSGWLPGDIYQRKRP